MPKTQYLNVKYGIRHLVLPLGLLLCWNAHATHEPEPAGLEVSPGPGQLSLSELPFNAPASDVLVTDLDKDGRLDLAFTSHGGNFSQVFFQREPRRFESGPKSEAVGYHPGNLLEVRHEKGSSLLMSAEGAGRLYTLALAENGELSVAAEARVPFPRFTASFRWPEWGLGMAVAPFSPPSVMLLKEYDPIEVKAASRVNLPLKGTAFPLQSIAIADLDGDDIDEIILPFHQRGMLRVIRYPGPEGEIKVDSLWQTPSLGTVKHVAVADVNGDGRVDLLAPQESPKPGGIDKAFINLLLNKGNRELELIELEFPSKPRAEGGMPGIRGLDTAVDQDGKRYILAAGYDAYVLYQLASNVPLGSIPSRNLPFAAREAIFEVLLKDVDGDGWLDAVVARGRDEAAGLVIYGPLWDNFHEYAEGEMKTP